MSCAGCCVETVGSARRCFEAEFLFSSAARERCVIRWVCPFGIEEGVTLLYLNLLWGGMSDFGCVVIWVVSMSVGVCVGRFCMLRLSVGL